MKNFFKKFKSYGFWVSLSSALVVLLNCLGRIFGFSIENQLVEDLVMSIAGVLLVLGIVSMKGNSKGDAQEGDDEQEEEQRAEKQKENEQKEDSSSDENMNKD